MNLKRSHFRLVTAVAFAAAFGAASDSYTAILTKGTRECSVDYYSSGAGSSSTTNGVISCTNK